MLKKLLMAGAALLFTGGIASAKELNSIGATFGSLGNPFFIAMGKGVETKAKEINPNVRITTVSADYDLNKQFSQVDNFIAAGVDMLLINAVDPKAIEPAVKRAQAAGIVVVAIDVAAAGADATVQTNNVKAGELACQYLVDKLGGKGDIIIINGPQVSSIVDRVKGCKDVLAKAPAMKILSDDQDGKASRDGGLNAMQGLLTRFPHVDGVFAINDPTGIGADLAAKQLGRNEMIITAVDGAPDIEVELKNPNSLIKASSSQDPYTMALLAIGVGNEIIKGNKPAEPMTLMDPKLLTADNIAEFKGWGSH